MALHPDLSRALAVAPRILVTVVDPNGGDPLVGEVMGAVSETHVRFLANDGLAFTLPTADLRVLAAVRVGPDAEAVAS